MLPAVKVLIVAVRAESIPLKKLVEVADVNVDAPDTARSVIVVVASVEVPSTTKSPVEVAPVKGLIKNDAFSVQPLPFQ
jgi:hypothetical protein